MNEVGIRCATRHDASFIAWVQLAAARSHCPIGFFDLALPGDEGARLDLLARVVATGERSLCHWSGFLVAEVDGQPAAALSAYEPEKVGGHSFAAAMYEGLGSAGWTKGEVRAAFERMAPYMTCARQPPGRAWVVEWVATKPAFRRRGLVARMLAQVLETGRRAGYELAQISLLIGNEPARCAYQKAGFQEVDEARSSIFERTFGCPGILRMRCSL